MRLAPSTIDTLIIRFEKECNKDIEVFLNGKKKPGRTVHPIGSPEIE